MFDKSSSWRFLLRRAPVPEILWEPRSRSRFYLETSVITGTISRCDGKVRLTNYNDSAGNLEVMLVGEETRRTFLWNHHHHGWVAKKKVLSFTILAIH